ncbi:MAG: kelch repeat-containing protein [Candidatus Aminicenantes bacterium]|nr:kelch repeat-containing protein [Candidatus Aminicenantes bacterium]
MGKVLVCGGYNGSDTLQSAELYDPENDVFQVIPVMTTARQLHTATLLQNGEGSYLWRGEPWVRRLFAQRRTF